MIQRFLKWRRDRRAAKIAKGFAAGRAYVVERLESHPMSGEDLWTQSRTSSVHGEGPEWSAFDRGMQAELVEQGVRDPADWIPE